MIGGGTRLTEIGGTQFQSETQSTYSPKRTAVDWAEEILKTNKNLISNVSLTPEELKD